MIYFKKTGKAAAADTNVYTLRRVQSDATELSWTEPSWPMDEK